MPRIPVNDPERTRLAEDEARLRNWKRWGPYLSERQWGTVREDYSKDGNAWDYFSHDHSRSRAYRWGEDGLLGFTDRECRLCFSIALWNGKDPILKERLFGLTGPEGNHGEDVKEVYFYLDSTPTHSWCRGLYKYPQARFPYEPLKEENRRRTRSDPEYELLDTGVFDGERYFDVEVVYAKAGTDDLCIEIKVANRGPDPAPLHVLPTLWFRNTWSWGCEHEGCEVKPRLREVGPGRVSCDHATLERMIWVVEPDGNRPMPPLLFTENETNVAALFGGANASPYVKDAIHAAVVAGRADATNPEKKGTKVSAHHQLTLAAGEERTIRLRLFAEASAPKEPFGPGFDAIISLRRTEADRFFDGVPGSPLPEGQRAVVRQAYAGLLWSKQFYHYVVKEWLEGDPEQPRPPPERRHLRNRDWEHLFNRDILAMPDKWEYPWYAAWDTAFHMVAMARVDAHFAKEQLNLFLREWYLHPNGQIPAYEWALSDVNPPVHAWACWRVYKLTGPQGKRDRVFLARTFQKLLLNFTWWVNRKDPNGNNLFSGGFLGLDNVGVFDRSKPLPGGCELAQADGTAWMAFYCGTMLTLALELADGDSSYEDIASKFFEHFVRIADAINHLGGSGLWHSEDGFYYDQLVGADGVGDAVRLRSMVGIVPLFAVELIDEARLNALPGFAKRTRWFLKHRRDLSQQIAYFSHDGQSTGNYLLAIPSRERLERVLRYVFDEKEFLSPHGVRSLSRAYAEEPFVLKMGEVDHQVRYVPGDSDSGLFGGNSNWRGPVWFPMNFLLIESLERYHRFYGETFTIEFPTGSGQWMNLEKAAQALSARLSGLFLRNEQGFRPCHGMDSRFANDPHWRDHVWFHEYFHGDDGRGLGASHQTGWTALVANLMEDLGKSAANADAKRKSR